MRDGNSSPCLSLCVYSYTSSEVLRAGLMKAGARLGSQLSLRGHAEVISWAEITRSLLGCVNNTNILYTCHLIIIPLERNPSTDALRRWKHTIERNVVLFSFPFLFSLWKGGNLSKTFLFTRQRMCYDYVRKACCSRACVSVLYLFICTNTGNLRERSAQMPSLKCHMYLNSQNPTQFSVYGFFYHFFSSQECRHASYVFLSEHVKRGKMQHGG